MSHELTAAQYSLKLAIPEVKQLLRDFLLNSQFNSQINLAFSLSLPQQSDSAKEIISQWLAEEGVLPGIEIVPSSSINGALGAYAAQTDTIYLSQEFLIQNQHNSDAVRNVLLEELGHAFSAQLNLEDAPGDEGNLFAHLVLGNNLSDHQLEDIKIEDDTATVILDEEITEIEQAKPGENTAFDLIGLTALRNDPNFADIDGTGFDVVVIDSGLDRTRPLLDDNYRFGLDYIDGDSNPNDLRGHGTHVSGTIGAENETIGVATDVGLIGLKIGDEKQPNSEAVTAALRWVLNEARNSDSEYNIAAINLSLGLGSGLYTSPNQPNSPDDIEQRNLIRDLEAEGIVVVAAAGNSYIGEKDKDGNLFDSAGNVLNPNQEPNLGAPAIYSTIAVGAVWHSDQDPSGDYDTAQIPGEDRIAVFSQRLDADNFLFAPGVVIKSTYPERPLKSIDGTSQAAPHVTGSVALLQEIAAKYNVRLTPEQIRFYLIRNADIIADGDDEIDIVTNTNTAYPRINIHRSAIALREDLEDIFAPSSPNNTIEDFNDKTREFIEERFGFPEIPEIPEASGATAADALIVSTLNATERPETSLHLALLPEDIGFDNGENLTSNADELQFYTANKTEINADRELNSFSSEGASYVNVDPLTGQPELVPIYHFLNQDTGIPFDTIFEIEREAIQELDNFIFEGEVFSAYESEVEGSIPIYRFFDSSTGEHFYTPSTVESYNIEDNLAGYQLEGIAFYALPFSE